MLLPFVVLGLGVVLWGAVVRWRDIPPYVLPGPGLVFATLVADWAMLSEALIVTLTHHAAGLCRSPRSAASGLPCCSTSRA